MDLNDLKKQVGFSLDISVVSLIEIFQKKLDMKPSEICNCLWYFLRNQRMMLKREQPKWSEDDLNHNVRVWLRKQNSASEMEVKRQVELELLRHQLATAKSLGMATENYEKKLKELEGAD